MHAVLAVIAVFLLQKCECGERKSVADELNGATAVFVGTIERTEIPDWSDAIRTTQRQAFTFRVRRAWKGVNSQTVNVSINVLHTCAYWFIKGREYLVYVSADQVNPKILWASACSRTAPIEEASEDLAELPEPEKEFGQ